MLSSHLERRRCVTDYPRNLQSPNHDHLGWWMEVQMPSLSLLLQSLPHQALTEQGILGEFQGLDDSLHSSLRRDFAFIFILLALRPFALRISCERTREPLELTSGLEDAQTNVLFDVDFRTVAVLAALTIQVVVVVEQKNAVT
jgi:hypothetical protein